MQYNPGMTQAKTVGVRLDERHADLLARLCEVEELKESEVVRRALRHYAKHLGVSDAKRPATKRARR